MGTRHTKHRLQTAREALYDITNDVMASAEASGVRDGICVVYCPHTSAGITINENADPAVRHDLLLGLEAALPDQGAFRHGEGNSSAHLKASAVGSSVTVILEDGRLVLGRWQGIYFCEFDGPRNREFIVKVLAG
jgi:secondary thiamine-phosphate synthase enzyme